MSKSQFPNSFTTKLVLDLGSVFSNEKMDVTVHFNLLPSRNSVVSAVAARPDGTVAHLSGLSSKFEENTDLFLNNNDISIIANLQTDSSGNITGGQSSGFIRDGGWTRYWWTEAVIAVV